MRHAMRIVTATHAMWTIRNGAMVGNGMMRTTARIVGRKMRAASLTAQAAHAIQPISSGVMMVSGITQITAATAGVKIIHAVQAVLMESAIRR